MKTILLTTGVIAFLALITVSCSKDNKQDQLNSRLNQTGSLLLKSYQLAKTNDDLLITQVDADGHYSDPSAMMEDSLYHMNDSLCTIYYLSFCKDMMDGDNMMGGNMMGGNTNHGSGMMANHNYMGDTAQINQSYRNVMIIRQAHPSHHPVK